MKEKKEVEKMIGVVATTAENLMVNYFMYFVCVFVAVRINVCLQ